MGRKWTCLCRWENLCAKQLEDQGKDTLRKL